MFHLNHPYRIGSNIASTELVPDALRRSVTCFRAYYPYVVVSEMIVCGWIGFSVAFKQGRAVNLLGPVNGCLAPGPNFTPNFLFLGRGRE